MLNVEIGMSMYVYNVHFFVWRRKKNDTYVIRQVLFCRTIYLFRWPCGNLWHVFLSQKLFFQYDPGYWQDLSARQNLPSRCLYLVQIVILATCSSDKPRIPPLTKMSSFLLTLLHLDKWQLAKCNVISSMHSETNTFPSTHLLGPHSVSTISLKKQLDETAE